MKRAEQVKQQTHTLTHSVCDVSESVCVCMCMCMSECGTVYECEWVCDCLWVCEWVSVWVYRQRSMWQWVECVWVTECGRRCVRSKWDCATRSLTDKWSSSFRMNSQREKRRSSGTTAVSEWVSECCVSIFEESSASTHSLVLCPALLRFCCVAFWVSEWVSEWDRYRYPHGENYRDIMQRLAPIVAELESAAGAVLIVAHQVIHLHTQSYTHTHTHSHAHSCIHTRIASNADQ